MAKDYKFEVTGGFLVGEKMAKMTEYHAHDGRVIGFQLPDGRIVRLIVALEIENENDGTFKYASSQNEMEELGFGCLDYDQANFCETEETS